MVDANVCAAVIPLKTHKIKKTKRVSHAYISVLYAINGFASIAAECFVQTNTSKHCLTPMTQKKKEKSPVSLALTLTVGVCAGV